MSDQQQPSTHKIALGIEYDGSKYYGWQRQNEVRSVQEKLEKALSQVANERINVFCAGRTDAGVHGTGQVVHFETTAQRKDAARTLGVNANLLVTSPCAGLKLYPMIFMLDLAPRLAVIATSSTIIGCALRFWVKG